jgi:nucleotide-binding universal stress UspA family protein
MSPKAIISYDDTLNDHDALALGRVLATVGAELELAYVRHTTQSDRSREELDQNEAEALLERGARWLDNLEVPRRVVMSASTGEGLAWLAADENADIVVFGSDYRTAAGHVDPGTSARRLLEGGTAAVAIAPANYRGDRNAAIRTIGVLDGDEAARQTANEIADRFGAAVVSAPAAKIDLLVVASRPEAQPGRVMISAQAERAIEDATVPVLVVPRGKPVRFAVPATAAH